MALGLRRQQAPVAEPTKEIATRKPRSIVASAALMKMDGQGWRTYKFGDSDWQQDAWRLYDVIGELRFVANWMGSALSNVRLYVAEVDKNGRIQKEVEADKKPKIAALADNLFGSPAAKKEALRLLGINLTIAGDAFVVGTGSQDSGSDSWRVFSVSELRRRGNSLYYTNPDDGLKEAIDTVNSIIFRVWTPHPRRVIQADAPTRSALPILFEIERLTRFVFAQIDSRIASAGVVFLPQEASFPDDDDNELQLTGAEAFTDHFTRTAASSLKGDGTAAGVVPLAMELPADLLGKVQYLTFASELSQQARELRSEALKRFSFSMDIDPSILNGVGSANHWGAWQVTEGQIKIHIEPMATRIADAFTSAFLVPALKVLKEDPSRYAFAIDTAPLTIRPQRLKDTMDMYKEGHVSRETVLIEGDYKKSDLPTEEEDLKRFTRELMLRDPNLFANPAVRKAAGYTEDILPEATQIQAKGAGPGGAGPPPPPAPPTGIMNHAPDMLPSATEAQNAPGGPPAVPSGAPPSGVVASASVPSAVTTFVVANAAVLRALEISGKRLLDAKSRGQFPDTRPHELHTVIPVKGVDHARKIMTGSLDHLATLGDHFEMSITADSLAEALNLYCLTLLVRGEPHAAPRLGEWLMAQGLLDGAP
jgi:hypothetical protein